MHTMDTYRHTVMLVLFAAYALRNNFNQVTNMSTHMLNDMSYIWTVSLYPDFLNTVNGQIIHTGRPQHSICGRR